jgi:hypothetical protein
MIWTTALLSVYRTKDETAWERPLPAGFVRNKKQASSLRSQGLSMEERS